MKIYLEEGNTIINGADNLVFTKNIPPALVEYGVEGIVVNNWTFFVFTSSLKRKLESLWFLWKWMR